MKWTVGSDADGGMGHARQLPCVLFIDTDMKITVWGKRSTSVSQSLAADKP